MDLPIMNKEQFWRVARELNPDIDEASFNETWAEFCHRKYGLCVDEGCPHHPKLHVCNPGEP